MAYLKRNKKIYNKKIINILKKVSLHPLFIFFGIYFIFSNHFIFFINYFLVICLHEFSHFLVAEKKGYKLNKFSLMPYGARLDLNENIQSVSDELLIILIGPMVNFIFTILCMVIWWIFPITYGITYYFFEANLYMLLFNLLPIYPLDGGRILKVILTRKLSFKNIKKVIRFINLTAFTVFIVLFVYSIFNHINFNLLVISIFILFTLLDENNNLCYERINYIYIQNNISNKLLNVKTYIVDSSVNLFYLIKNLHNNYYCEFKIVFNDKSIKTLNQTQIINHSTKLNLYMPLENLKNSL